MHAYFAHNIGSRHVSVLYGLGGAGKTQTALKFVQESEQSRRFSRVFFIDTSTLGTIDLGLKGLAAATHAGKTAEDALQWLISQRLEWLILFNNADDVNINLQQFIPRCTHGNILITTRNPELCVHTASADAQHRLTDMEETDAVELLLRSSRNESTPENMQVASKIVQTLHNFPLAVVQAGAFIYKHRCLKDYLDLYRTNRIRLLKEQPTQTHDDYAWTVYTTWQISFDHLTEPAARLLQLCSFLHHEGITESMFSRAVLYDGRDLGELAPTVEDLSAAQEFLVHFLTSPRTWDQLSFTEVITEIRGYSLMELEAHKEAYSIHPLVHDWTQSNL
ncbi:P-loop containing nucleoside triphosphate hydrolase protein, partial [Mycena maculata]